MRGEQNARGGRTRSRVLNQLVVLRTLFRRKVLACLCAFVSVVDFCIVLDSVNGIVRVQHVAPPFVLPGSGEIDGHVML